MNLKPVAKLDERNRSASKRKKKGDVAMSVDCDVNNFFFQFTANLHLEDACSYIYLFMFFIVIFSLIVTFYLTEPKSRSK